MNTLTKAGISQLTPEQRETVATIEASLSREERRLREQTRHYRGRSWLPGLAMGVLMLVSFYWPSKLVPFLMAACLWLLIEFHETGINRRLDALIELWESDKKKNKENDGCKAPEATSLAVMPDAAQPARQPAVAPRL